MHFEYSAIKSKQNAVECTFAPKMIDSTGRTVEGNYLFLFLVTICLSFYIDNIKRIQI